MERKKNGWDFVCEHPIITAIIIGTLADTISNIFGKTRKYELNLGKPDAESMKSCGSTEEEPIESKEEN